MEPANLNSPPDDARLEAWLREDAGAPLPDDGFSARVVAALPPRPRATSVWLQALPIAVGAAAGVAFMGWRGGTIDAASVSSALADGLSWIEQPAAAIALAIGALALVIASPSDESAEE